VSFQLCLTVSRLLNLIKPHSVFFSISSITMGINHPLI
jgi:hypothetical protein